MSIENEIKKSAKNLVEEHGEKAIDIVKRRIDSFDNQYSKERDYNYVLLTEVEKIINKKNV